ncbi:hypothetical protein [Mycolicibacterium fluoranthenivorans]|uniref:Uncharacterized protein n=1 Tax=Mycolicibacterium fluoranthenivorans TaxID=258505 RepID=A0A7X5U450_9MYCO|nr:hypothetical protein [Mycolicibacterium fluoranthenivorans]MCV7358499.1 hypothetical protein [Mycolicibacterium fluoranthenivorans]NIH98075.1 hypothetical protein [Mycolicibacterium fluoranthenivorans]
MTDDELTVRYERWLPPAPEPELPRLPAKWDGRPFPGRCTHVDDQGAQCDNQAISSIGWWDGGGPGLGNWRQIAHCPIH